MAFRIFKNIHIVFALVFMIGISCTKKTNPTSNPLDPDTDEYDPPIVSIASSIVSGSVIEESQLTLELSGNEFVTEYRFKLDNYDWEDWTESSVITLDFLDEGDHIVQFQSRYLSGDESEVLSFDFTVDAVSGPSVMFYPRRAYAQNNETVTLEILAEEVENLSGFEFYIRFDQNKIQLNDIYSGGAFSSESGDPIFLTDQSNSGELVITSAVWGQDAPAFNGTGSLVILSFKMLQESDAFITFEGNQIFRNSSNSTITIREIISGYITQ